MPLPPLPARSNGQPWSNNVEHAYQLISMSFSHAEQVMSQEADSSRLQYHADALTEDVIPLLVEMEVYAQQESIPIPWLHSCAISATELVFQLLTASETSGAQ